VSPHPPEKLQLQLQLQLADLSFASPADGNQIVDDGALAAALPGSQLTVLGLSESAPARET
jgi:hypothetical protein